MGLGHGYTEGKITHSLFGMNWRFLDGLKAWIGNRKSNRIRTQLKAPNFGIWEVVGGQDGLYGGAFSDEWGDI